MRFCEPILNQSQDHAYAGGAKAIMPIVFLAQRSAYERTNERAQIDPHVINAETRVPPRATLRIKLPHHGADVRLEQPGAGDHQDQAKVKSFLARYGQSEVT